MKWAAILAAFLLAGCAGRGQKYGEAVEYGAAVGAGLCFSWNWSERGVEWEGATLRVGPESASYCTTDEGNEE